MKKPKETCKVQTHTAEFKNFKFPEQRTKKTMKNLHVIHELGGNHDTCYKQTMNIERIERQRGLPLSKSIKINVGNDETRWATICILEDPL